MRTFLGILALVLGGGLLAYWAHGNDAVRIERHIGTLAAAAVGGTTHEVTTQVSGRDIHVSGIADSEDEKRRILATLDNVEGRRVVTEDLRVLKRVFPFTLEVTKENPESALVAAGHVPSEAIRSSLGLGDAAAALELASGAPEGWDALARAGIAAMSHLQNGRMLLSDGHLTITGEAAGPDRLAAIEEIVSGLPEGTATTEINLPNDGADPAWRLDYSAVDGARLSGVLPRGIDAAAIAGALGLATVGGEATTTLAGEQGDIGFLSAFRDWMARLETFSIEASPSTRAAVIAIQTDEDAADLRAALENSGIEANVSVVSPQGSNGDRRVNAASGATERYMGGFWLPLPEGETDIGSCQGYADSVLNSVSVNFVTGSDRLDAGAVRAINELARFMIRCVEDGGLKAEIGGHTDNVGEEQANLDLSQRRAAVVRDQLIARGVLADALIAKGYGMSQPVAGNDTEEGRARNRRTTVVWSN